MTLNCIAVDDEPLALGLICSFIEQTPFLKLGGSFSSGIKALEALHEHNIDLIFLDIQMPDLTGIQLARTLESRPGGVRPRVIFTTAFNNYAIEGYKVDALDYLLKPYDYEEFLKAANKARSYAELLKPAQQAGHHSEEYIFLKVEYQMVRVEIKKIVYIEGLKDYAKIYLLTEARPLLSLITLKALEEKLPSQQFMRIHRSFIIALDKIESVSKSSVQIGGTTVNIGEQYKETMREFLSNRM
ncbi:MAG TPA: LytTR family DNA-binding domain-containing protein [Pedobacter sp.]|uniref:LytR/AlgR family response regulator transcription factor n=1 Tax=Pedobacter sp. TaxID=1411316 RepID=UPI002B84E395|nr:LytTR family DNA-binding domain-containing protein [Pedobacter sp.]HMI02784.1 LytTR family DNA-binding domain-containing protein [Pedobacter sp.]